ncbi:MAG: PAS domain-containing sensor histidine kinase, partial [Candidatus Nitrosotalea sp.]|nr:PAS domain-containing sensor histidine kinase [Candidatus Nitrosotalea sp.]
MIAAYGLNVQGHYSTYAFILGVGSAASGGVIVWASMRQGKTFQSQPYVVISEKTTSNQEAKYKNIYEGSPILQRTVNTSGIILECNPAYVKSFGNSKEEIIGRSIFDHVAEKSMNDMKNAFESWKKSNKVDNVEIWFKRKDGSTFPALLSANNIYDEKGKLVGSNTYIRNMTDVYEAHKVLDEHERQKIQIDEMQKMDSSKAEFYMTVAKESQIPIAPILKYSKILHEIPHGKLTVKQVEAITEIHDNAVKLDQLMVDILDVQKLNTKTMEYKKEQFGVSDLMNQVIELCNPMMKDKKIEFVDSSSTKKSISSDHVMLDKVFFNLIQNAVDFVPTKQGRIEIGAKEEGNSVVFYVKDNGIGIMEKKKDFVFKKFYQVDISFKRKYGGSGFGLVICKGIVENLGGKIWFDTKEGEGTTFYFSISA